MPRKDFFQPGERCGRHKVVEASAHGQKVQRYRAHDPTIDQRVLITCARADHKPWAARFEELARKRAQIPSTPRVLDWGVTPNGVFYVAEEDLEGQSLDSLVGRAREGAAGNPLMASIMVCFAYLCGLADTLSHFAGLGFWHGAFHPSATFKLSGRGTAVTGIGMLQILGCAQGPELGEGKYLAPEVRAGLDFDERADVFSVCSFVWDRLRGNESDAETLRQLGDLAEPFIWGMKADPAARPRWEDLRLLVFRLLGQLALASGGQTERLIGALTSEGTSQPTDAPKTQPRTPRTDAVVRQEYAQTLRELSADQMGGNVEEEKEWVWKEYPRQILEPATSNPQSGTAHERRGAELLPEKELESKGPKSEEITPPPHAWRRSPPVPPEDASTKASPNLKPPIPAQSPRPMESSESEPITLRSIPFRYGRAYRTWALLGMVAVMAAFMAFLGLHWRGRPELRGLDALQWPEIPKAYVNVPARAVEEEPAPWVERSTEAPLAAQKRRAQKKRWTLCDVAACPPDGRPLRD